MLLVSFAVCGQSMKNKEAEVDSFLTAQIKTFQIPALSVAIVENGAVRFQKTYGMANLEYQIPNTPQTAFQLASVTKLLSATAIAMLIEEGRLDLDQKVTYYLNDLPQSWDSMLIKDLVAHQSGIVDLLALKQELNSVDEALKVATEKPLDFEPGTKTVYAGGDYAVVMKIIETVGGMPFQEFIKTYLFDKVGMENSCFNNMEQDFIYRTYDMMPNAATVYVWDEKQDKQRVFSMMFPKWTYPAGGLFSSVEDLCKWVIALDNGALLSEKFSDLLWTPVERRDGTTSPFGIGWIVDKFKEETATGHSGGPALADIVRLPEKKITAIVLTNQLTLRPFLTMKVLEMYLAEE